MDKDFVARNHCRLWRGQQSVCFPFARNAILIRTFNCTRHNRWARNNKQNKRFTTQTCQNCNLQKRIPGKICFQRAEKMTVMYGLVNTHHTIIFFKMFRHANVIWIIFLYTVAVITYYSVTSQMLRNPWRQSFLFSKIYIVFCVEQ